MGSKMQRPTIKTCTNLSFTNFLMQVGKKKAQNYFLSLFYQVFFLPLNDCPQFCVCEGECVS